VCEHEGETQIERRRPPQSTPHSIGILFLTLLGNTGGV
jgi:hypothetical protein